MGALRLFCLATKQTKRSFQSFSILLYYYSVKAMQSQPVAFATNRGNRGSSSVYDRKVVFVTISEKSHLINGVKTMPRKIDAASALAEIKRQRKISSRGSGYSKLNRYRSSLVSLRLAGASYRDLVFWLRKHHRINTNHTTMMRWMKSLPEFVERS